MFAPQNRSGLPRPAVWHFFFHMPVLWLRKAFKRKDTSRPIKLTKFFSSFLYLSLGGTQLLLMARPLRPVRLSDSSQPDPVDNIHRIFKRLCSWSPRTKLAACACSDRIRLIGGRKARKAKKRQPTGSGSEKSDSFRRFLEFIRIKYQQLRRRLAGVGQTKVNLKFYKTIIETKFFSLS